MSRWTAAKAARDPFAWPQLRVEQLFVLFGDLLEKHRYRLPMLEATAQAKGFPESWGKQFPKLCQRLLKFLEKKDPKWQFHGVTFASLVGNLRHCCAHIVQGVSRDANASLQVCLVV